MHALFFRWRAQALDPIDEHSHAFATPSRSFGARPSPQNATLCLKSLGLTRASVCLRVLEEFYSMANVDERRG